MPSVLKKPPIMASKPDVEVKKPPVMAKPTVDPYSKPLGESSIKSSGTTAAHQATNKQSSSESKPIVEGSGKQSHDQQRAPELDIPKPSPGPVSPEASSIRSPTPPKRLYSTDSKKPLPLTSKPLTEAVKQTGTGDIQQGAELGEHVSKDVRQPDATKSVADSTPPNSEETEHMDTIDNHGWSLRLLLRSTKKNQVFRRGL